ncbi:Ig-like domain-containing protein [Herbiconiux sp.]|uniref:Ig-like domain-containing protein n=1 Tax=Herbiconiux sp. TaxID=1871186 RepID=UPI0025C44B23|nr:Ig-like domain-containing protein [Herbiconiux sp.]
MTAGSLLARARNRIRSHRAGALTATAGTAVAALVVVTAVVSTGYTAQKVELDDATVWVSSDLHQAVGRANPPLAELNTALRMESGALDVSQFGQTVVVSDLGRSEARLIDTASAAVTDTVALPAGDVDVQLSGTLAVITSHTSGDVWMLPSTSLARFDATAPPDLTLGEHGDTVVSAAGTVYAVSPATGSVFAVDPAIGAEGSTTWPIGVEASDDVSITAVGDRWVVLDADSGTLFTQDGSVVVEALAGVASDDPSTDSAGDPGAADGRAPVALQSPSPDASADVLVATSASLLAVTLSGGATQTLDDGHRGLPATPARADGCWYAAWSDGRSWSRCDGDPVVGTLSGAVATDDLVFRTNGTGGILLSDTVSGRSWDVVRENAPIDDWDLLLPDSTDDESAEEAVTDQPAQVDPAQRPPVATDDDLGARPGRSTVLPVLQNDYDPNGDVVVIDSVQLPEGADWTIDRIQQNQQLQLTLPETVRGEIGFGYTISDGRGGRAEATVRVTVRDPSENSAPVQSSSTTADVGLGGRTDLDIRSDWFDPDGDAFFVLSAGVQAPDTVTSTPEGVVTFTDSGQSTGTKEVSVTVSDGSSASTGILTVRTHPVDEVPLVAEGFVVLASAGQEVEADPLEHVRGASADSTAALRLTNVPAKDGYTLSPDYSGGTVRITAASAGDGILDYAVSDGARTAAGTIRVIATSPPDANTRPVTVPHSAFARQNTSVLVDVLAGDFDQAGGVLIVSQADQQAEAQGARVEVIDQRMIRVTLSRPLDTGTITFGYTVTNGLAEARGSVTVIAIPDPLVHQPPIAVADSASVRVGDVVDIPVLANDVHPDGDALTLNPDLVQGLGDGSGLLFASGSRLRYLAPNTPGDFTAVYRVDAPDGQWATAAVTISVREADPAANAAPVPPLVTARVIAGETVRIPIPLTGIDPDGDSVQFLGIDSVPDKGTVGSTGADWIDFEAGEYSSGTDTFRYTVMDRLGSRVTGAIRVGISPRLEGARNPVATADDVLVRPGKTVSVRVLQNDSDPDGSPLRVTAVEPVGGGSADLPSGEGPDADAPDADAAAAAAENGGGNGATATVVDDTLRFVAPAETGRYGFIYTIANERGGTSSAFATLEVSQDAPLSRPQVSDTVLSLTDILDKQSVDVDVLADVFFAEGPASQLWLSVLPAYSQVAKVVDGRIRVQVQDRQQVIPFTVAHPDDPNIRSSGFLWVPGQNDALPQLRTGAPKLTVESGATLRIAVNDYVVAVDGRQVRVADTNSVRATHADGASLVDGSGTLVFTSADKYFGPASVSFQVADGDGPTARTATLVLPITVTPRADQPPVFSGAVIEFEPGQQKAIDLSKLTTSASGGSGALTYQVLEPRPAGFSAVLLGSTLTITVDPGTKKGSQGAYSIGVAAGAVAGQAGRIEMTVVPSTKPLAIPATDTVVAPRGATTPIDVLANDDATNPFPQIPLTVVSVRGIDSASLPAGVAIAPSADRRVLQVTVAQDAAPADLTVQYQVLDGTGDPERAAWGTVRIAVQDRPGQVTGVAVTAFGDRTVTVSFSPGVANNAPITGFEVTARTPGGAGGVTRCASTRCVVATPGNGPGNAVNLSVTARNALGLSDPVGYSVPVWSDLLPSAPAALTVAPLDGALAVTWGASSVGAGGSEVSQYDVAANGRLVATLDAAGPGCGGSGCSTTVGGLANGSSAEITVTARNGAYPALAVWPSATASGTPYGAPLAQTITAVANLDAGPGTVTVRWPEFGGNGNAVAGYIVQQLTPGAGAAPGGAQSCTVSTPAPGAVTLPQTGGEVLAQQVLGAEARAATFTGLTGVDTAYPFVVWAYNAAGCAASGVVSAVAYPSPGVIDAGALQAGLQMVRQDPTVEVQVTLVPTSGTVSNPRYYVQAVDQTGAPAGSPTAMSVPGLPRAVTQGLFGEPFRFQMQACNVWGGTEVCGPYSSTMQAPEPSLTFAFGTAPRYDGTSWGWTDDPPNGALVPTYYCGSKAAGAPARDEAGRSVTATSCTPTTPVAAGDAWLLVAIGAYDYVYFG